MHFNAWQWMFLALGAFMIGLTKTGLPGLGVLAVAFFANVLPARASTGALLPLLLCADVVALARFRKHADWAYLWRLFPWVLPGILAGYLALGTLSDPAVRRLIGGILVVMVGLNTALRFRPAGSLAHVPHAAWFTALTGLAAGFATMVANAAGPVMTLYLLAVGLPKLVLVGTGAWFFMLVNAGKVPFSLQLGLINLSSLWLDLALVPPMLAGTLLGPVLLRKLNQSRFETVTLLLSLLATLRMFL
jgi:uncharacterized protein